MNGVQGLGFWGLQGFVAEAVLMMVLVVCLGFDRVCCYWYWIFSGAVRLLGAKRGVKCSGFANPKP